MVKNPYVKICKNGQVRIYNINPITNLKRSIRKNIKNKLLCSILIEGLK